MDEQRFDAALKALHTGTTRRNGLAAALGVLLGGAGLAVDAKGRTPGNPGAEGPCGDGSAKANRCKKDGDCCTKYCSQGECRCKPNWMTCTKNDHCCSGVCLSGRCDGGAKPAGGRCEENFNCQDGLACIKGLCTTSKTARCTKQTCSGCCEGTTCRVGGSKQACGTKGAACSRCAGGTTCAAGICDGGGQSQTIIGSGPGTANNQFNAPVGPAISADGRSLYVADAANQRIAEWTRTSTTAKWQAQAALGSGLGTANNQFSFPRGVTLSPDSLTLYVADSFNNRIAIWTRPSVSAPWQAQTPLGNGQGTANDQFDNPFATALAENGLELYISDLVNQRIAVWTRASTASPWGAQSPLGNGFGPANDQFSGPGGLALSPDSLNLYIADSQNYRVDVWSRTSTSAPWQAQAPIGNGQGSANDQFDFPTSVALSENGLALYVVDRDNNRIDVWTRASTSDPWQAQAPLGSGPGTADDEFSAPAGVALSADGLALYVGDTGNNRIVVRTL